VITRFIRAGFSLYWPGNIDPEVYMLDELLQDSLAVANQPKQQRSQETIQKILQAACQCVAELGYGQASTIKIAKTAGVSQGALFKHFPNKIALMVAMTTYYESRARMEAVANMPADILDVSIKKRICYFVDGAWTFCQSLEYRAIDEVYAQSRTDQEMAKGLKSLVLSDAQAGDLALLIPELANNESVQWLSQLAYAMIDRLGDVSGALKKKTIIFRLEYIKQMLEREVTLLVK